MIFTIRDLTGEIGDAEVSISTPLGRGATAIIYPAVFQGEPCAAKIYHQDRTLDTAKITAMLANVPANVRIRVAGDRHPQLAWPFAILSDRSGRDVGYLMPLVDPAKSFSIDHYYDQILLKKLKSPSEGALSFKLEIARNLCLLVADLHDHGHYFIDIKPQNIRVLLGSHVVTLVDCDGFSIAGPDGTRYPAELVSSDYIAPEAYRNNTIPAQLGETQDRYALAVILFQLMNRGTHPFQGIIHLSSITASTNDEKAAKGLYPHGITPDVRITPRPQSIHFLLDDGLRTLFDAAFIGKSDSRPSARDWADCLDKLLRDKGLGRCDKEPYDLTHMRFTGKQCPTCYLARIKPMTIPSTRVEPVVSSPIPSWKPPTPVPKPESVMSNFGWVVVAILVGLFLIWIVSDSSKPAAPTSKQPVTASGADLPPPPPLEPATRRAPTPAQLEASRGSARSAISAAASNSAPPIPMFNSADASIKYLAWLDGTSEKLKNVKPDLNTRREFLQTLWYESRRAGLEPGLVLGLIETASSFRKYYISENGSRGYMVVSPYWAGLLGDGDAMKLFHMQTNLRFGCVVLRHYLDQRKGDLSFALKDYYESNVFIEGKRQPESEFPDLVMRNMRQWL